MSSSAQSNKTTKDVQDIYISTKTKLEEKLAETEAHVQAVNVKAFDAVTNTVNGSHSLVENFMQEKLVVLSKSSDVGSRRIKSLSKISQGIPNFETKISSIDQTQELVAYRKRCIEELEQELNKVRS
eukprot:CAMPEP_0174957594 /NCGR_PEP_ID=MMETSP0004_2-20121128/2158_1 /TAXON_ID=420556 /ORGANISM="Ochromonas sp., Strain CCMP1393" /LENGTH=126 /DNA_ID=CAMNT_0016205719 /DNA_START=47 /DNA_END=427 /DNA_ORIENTATION=+